MIMEKRCVYILKWERYYVWSTNDIERRIKEHREKWYSSKRIWEWKLISVIECKDREEARNLEKRIKRWWHYERWWKETYW